MPKRLLTFLLILAILVPTSLFGSVLHRCEMMDGTAMAAAEMPLCCSQALQRDDGTVQISHQCDTASATVEGHPAATTFKTQHETPYPADCVSESIVFYPTTDFLSRFPAGASDLLLAGSHQPVFLRNCTFLI